MSDALSRAGHRPAAVTLQDAAVKLRRLSAYVDRGRQARLLGSALAAVERAVERAVMS